MMTHDTEGGDGPQHRSSVHIKLEHQGNLRMVQHGLRTIQTLHTSSLIVGTIKKVVSNIGTMKRSFLTMYRL